MHPNRVDISTLGGSARRVYIRALSTRPALNSRQYNGKRKLGIERGSMSRWPMLFLPAVLVVVTACNAASMGEGGAPAITIGSTFACALEDDGTPFCWNLTKEVDFKQISPVISTFDGPFFPPPEGESFVSLSSGDFHTCGLREDGMPVCWTPTSNPVLSPLAPPPEGERFTSIVSHNCYTCGLRPDGIPLCWAQFHHPDFCPFQLVEPPAGETFVALKGDAGYSCGLRHDGTFLCWLNIQASESEGNKVPKMLEGERFTAISHGGWSFCAIRQDGTPTCWYYHVVADKFVRDAKSSDPDVGTIVSISTGSFHSCGLRENGAPVCWWIVDDGRRGPGPSDEERFVAITSRGFFSCGLRADDSHLCWAAIPSG